MAALNSNRLGIDRNVLGRAVRHSRAPEFAMMTVAVLSCKTASIRTNAKGAGSLRGIESHNHPARYGIKSAQTPGSRPDFQGSSRGAAERGSKKTFMRLASDSRTDR